MTEAQLQEWLDRFATSANNKDLPSHLGMISREVRVFGVPGFEALGYEDWQRQCSHEFAEGILDSVSYQGLEILAQAEQSMMFKTVETVQGTDGTINRAPVEMVIRCEDDGQWRLIQQRMLSDE